LEPRTREVMAERANPLPRACPWWIGTGSTKIWVPGRCCHEDRGRLVEGRVMAGSFWLQWYSLYLTGTIQRYNKVPTNKATEEKNGGENTNIICGHSPIWN
jgi:hypothetical protein